MLLALASAALLQIGSSGLIAAGAGSSARVEAADATRAAKTTNGDQESTDSPTYPLKGTVVDSVTGEPIRGALVQIYAGKERSIRTGADGRFQFEGLPGGMGTVVCRKPGYFSEEEIYRNAARRNFVQVGPDTPPLVLKLVPEGVIYGRISGDDGLPVEGLPIHLMVRKLDNGEMRWFPQGNVRTNEDGEFRVAELQPGSYYLFIGPSQTPVVLSSRSSEGEAKGYPAVFYPGVSDLASAAPILITPGRHAEILFSMSVSPFFRVSGTVGGYPHGQFIHLQFHNATGEAIGSNLRFDQQTGEFQSGWLPAGSYTLKAMSSDRNGRVVYTDSRPVNLSSNVSGVHLSLVPGISIPVSIRVETTKPETESEVDNESQGGGTIGFSQSLRMVGRGFSAANVVLHAKDDVFLHMQYAAEEIGGPQDPSLAIQNIPPGTYEVEIQPNGPYYVQSARSGSLDLLRKDITIAPGASVQPFEITLRDDTAALRGRISFEGQEGEAAVLAMPDHGREWIQTVAMTNSGNPEFDFSQLPPGAYKVLAVDRIDGLEYKNPDVMRKYISKAQDVTLEPNQSASITLELVHVQE